MPNSAPLYPDELFDNPATIDTLRNHHPPPPPARTPRPRRRKADEYRAMRDHAVALLTKISDHDLEEAVRRRGIVEEVDGYPTSSRGQEGGKASAEPNPTYSAATAFMPDENGRMRRLQPDPQGQAIERLLNGLEAITMLARAAAGGNDLVIHISKTNRGRQPAGGDCLACGKFCSGARNDRLMSYGFCNSCRMAWQRAHQADPHLERQTWAMRRRGELAKARADWMMAHPAAAGAARDAWSQAVGSERVTDDEMVSIDVLRGRNELPPAPDGVLDEESAPC